MGFELTGRLHAERLEEPLRHAVLAPLLEDVRQHARQTGYRMRLFSLGHHVRRREGGTPVVPAKAREPHLGRSPSEADG